LIFMALSTPNYWRLQSQRYRIEGNRCKGCQVLYFPQRKVCLSCGGTEFDIQKLSGKGKIVSWTIIRAAPTGFEAPYAAGIVQLEEGPHLTTQLIGPQDQLEIGKGVRAAFRRLIQNEDGLIVYGFKFELEE